MSFDDDQLAFFDERAAIMEYDGYQSREAAEAYAADTVQRFFPLQDAKEATQGMALRPYQKDAVQAILEALQRDKHPVANLATGSGKSLIAAALAAKLPGRVLVVTHRKKLLSQNSAQLSRYLGSAEDLGVYSAGLDQRDATQRVIFGGVQSIYKRMDELTQAGPFSHIIVDECHLVGAPGADVMYTAVLRHNPTAQRIGLSATPTRMGVPCWGEGKWFSDCVHTTSITSLTPEYLAPLSTILTAQDVDLSKVRIRQGEYVASDASQVMSEEKVAKAALDEICLLAAQRKKWAIFCCDIAHTRLVAGLLVERGITCGVLLSDQPSAENDKALADFEQGKTRALASCVMMTTGFDIPSIDCVVLLRPTMSKELLIQMIGRGTRKAEAKDDCLILDYANNLERHWPLDEISATARTEGRKQKDAKKAQETQAERERQAKHKASLLVHATTYDVQAMKFDVVPSKSKPGKMLVRVGYLCKGKSPAWVSTWLCVEYSGWARHQAELWYDRRGLDCPRDAGRAVEIAKRGKRPQSIAVVQDGQWDRVLMEYFD